MANTCTWTDVASTIVRLLHKLCIKTCIKYPYIWKIKWQKDHLSDSMHVMPQIITDLMEIYFIHD